MINHFARQSPLLFAYWFQYQHISIYIFIYIYQIRPKVGARAGGAPPPSHPTPTITPHPPTPLVRCLWLAICWYSWFGRMTSTVAYPLKHPNRLSTCNRPFLMTSLGFPPLPSWRASGVSHTYCLQYICVKISYNSNSTCEKLSHYINTN